MIGAPPGLSDITDPVLAEPGLFRSESCKFLALFNGSLDITDFSKLRIRPKFARSFRTAELSALTAADVERPIRTSSQAIDPKLGLTRRELSAPEKSRNIMPYQYY
jgi:hypothetical protein